LGNDCG